MLLSLSDRLAGALAARSLVALRSVGRTRQEAGNGSEPPVRLVDVRHMARVVEYYHRGPGDSCAGPGQSAKASEGTG